MISKSAGDCLKVIHFYCIFKCSYWANFSKYDVLFFSVVPGVVGVGESGVFKLGDFDPLETDLLFV